MYHSLHYEETYFRASLERRRAPVVGGRLALVPCLRPTPLPDPPGQRQRGTSPADCPLPGLRRPDRPQRHPCLQPARFRLLTKGSSRPHTIHAAFPGEQAEQLRGLLHQSPRAFGQPTSLWTLELAAEVSSQ